MGGAMAAFALILYVTSFYSSYAWGLGLKRKGVSRRHQSHTYWVMRGCSEAFYGIEANRWTSTDPNCPSLVDPLGMWMAWGYQTRPATSTFAMQWKSYFEKAHYVVLSSPGDPLVGWSPGLTAWFATHFSLDYHHDYVFIYRADAPGSVVSLAPIVDASTLTRLVPHRLCLRRGPDDRGRHALGWTDVGGPTAPTIRRGSSRTVTSVVPIRRRRRSFTKQPHPSIRSFRVR